VLSRTTDSVTVGTAFDGNITMPGDPQSIVAVFGEEDILIALGLANRGMADDYEISLEQIGLIDAVIVFVPTIDPVETEREFVEHPTLKTLPASQHDLVFAFPFTEVSGDYYDTRRAIALAVDLLTGEEVDWMA
jgi:ABC-type Fe3+-hydroxamate transport system substrate-binding protein